LSLPVSDSNRSYCIWGEYVVKTSNTKAVLAAGVVATLSFVFTATAQPPRPPITYMVDGTQYIGFATGTQFMALKAGASLLPFVESPAR
jgi:hypothetical protein